MVGSYRVAFVLSLCGFAAALALRLPAVGLRDVWYDEMLSQYAIWLDWWRLILDRVSAGHSPLYFLLLKGAGVPATDLVAMRAISAGTDALACMVFGSIALRLSGKRAAVLVMALYALQPMLLVWAQNARPYALQMLTLAIGLAGAVEVIAEEPRHRSVDWRSDLRGWSMTLGLSGAALTLTAGTIAVALIALSPFASKALRSDPVFRRRWLRLLAIPALATTAMLVIVTVPHVMHVSDSYWTNAVLPFTWSTLVGLGHSFVIGDSMAMSEMSKRIGTGPAQGLGLAGFAILLSAALKGAFQMQGRAEVLPVVALTVVYPLLFLAVSAWTSLLVPRYFLPAIAATSLFTGIGMAAWSRSRRGAGLVTVILGAGLFVAINQSLAPGPRHNPAIRRFSELILALSDDRTRVFSVLDDKMINALRTEIVPKSLKRGGHPQPTVTTPEVLMAELQETGQVFLVVPQIDWQGRFSHSVPLPDCLWQKREIIMAMWHGNGAACPALSE